jgi:hypothetical protein
MDPDSSDTEARTREEAVPGKRDTPLPIVITAATNLIHLQKLVKSVVNKNFEFRNTKNGTG